VLMYFFVHSFTWASANRADETSDAREQHDSLAIFFLRHKMRRENRADYTELALKFSCI